MVKVMKSGKEVDVELRKSTGKHKMQYYKAFAAIIEEPIINAIEYMDTMHSIILELQDVFKTKEELLELENPELNKIMNEIVDEFSLLGKKGFLSSSSKSKEQSPTTTPKQT